jgi:transcriptional regulator with XRE-family HTH domain
MSADNKKKQVIASRLTAARNQAGLSQGQVAKILNLHRPTVSEIEAGRRNVTAEELIKFAEIYGVNIEWFMPTDNKLSDPNRDRVELAARELGKLGKKDLERILDLLSALQKRGKK